VPRARIDHGEVRLLAQLLNKRRGLVHGTRRVEDFGVGHNTEEPAENKVREAVGLVRVDQFLQPHKIFTVAGSILAMGVSENLDVKENQVVLP